MTHFSQSGILLFSFTDCKSQPCQHGGVCEDIDSIDTYVCTCSKGYVGPNCEITIGLSFSLL